MGSRQAALFMFVPIGMWGGVHIGAWRDPAAAPDPSTDFEQIKRMVQTAERGKFHGLFLADTLALFDNMSHETFARTSQAVSLEPFTLCAALAACTKKIGLALTGNTSYNEPYHIARKFASLDHISGGRAAWNVVAGSNLTEARNFGRSEHFDHVSRYVRAQEFVEVVTGLWDSWDDDAFLRDKESGVYFDVERLHPLNHRGEAFSVEGPLTVPRPPQGHPVIAQAGSSEEGLELATSIGELIFTQQPDIESGRRFYAKVKDQVAMHGRDPDHALILPLLTVLLGRTQAEADEKLELINGLTDPSIGLERLSFLIDYDLSGFPLDGPVPEIPVTSMASKTQQEYFINLARKENLTVRQFAQLAIAGGQFTATPESVADHIEEWVSTGAADGFNVTFAERGSLEIFVDHVVPELQRRGVFHDDYHGGTLREYLGLPRPVSRYARAAGNV